MSKSKEKILADTINYLNFYKDHYNYTISENEIAGFKSPPLSKQKPVKIKIASPAEDKLKDKLNVALNPEAESIGIKESIDDFYQSEKESWMDCSTLDAFANEIKDCPKCKILAETRKQVVFGTGNPDADVVVVGEAPGADEDEQGKPFVGRAGKLLTDILKAINFTREEVYICNILKCRPPGNRNPLPEEIMNCEPYLFKQLEIIKPKMILAVGAFAAQTLLKSKETLGKMRGKFHTYNGIKMMVTFHPAALLRNPGWKKPTWEDVQLFRAEYDRMKTK